MRLNLTGNIHSQPIIFGQLTINLAFLCGWLALSVNLSGQSTEKPNHSANEILDSVEHHLIFNNLEKSEVWMNQLDTSKINQLQRIRSQIFTLDILRKKGMIKETILLQNEINAMNYSFANHKDRLYGYFLNISGVLAVLKDDPDYERAQQLLLEATTYLSNDDILSASLLVMVLDNISKIYLRKRDYLQASKFVNQAVDVLDRYPEIEDNLRYAVKMSMASIRSHLGFYDEATVYLEDALAYYEGKPQQDKHNIAVLYFNLGNISFKLQNYELSYAQYNQSRDLYASLYGPNDFLTIDAESSMASCLILSGKPDQGLEMQQNILDAMELNSYWDTLDYAEQLLSVGADLIAIMDNQKALPYLQNCIQSIQPIGQDLNKKSIAVLAYSYQSKSLVEIEQLHEAQHSNQIHRRLTLEVYGKDHFGMAYVNYIDGWIAFKKKDRYNALQFFDLALNQFQAHTNPSFYYDNFSVLDILLKRIYLFLEFYKEDQNPKWLNKIKVDLKESKKIFFSFDRDQYSYQAGYRIRSLATSFTELKLEFELLHDPKMDYLYQVFEDASSTLLASYVLERNDFKLRESGTANVNPFRELKIMRSYIEQEMKDPGLSAMQRAMLTDSLLAIHTRLKTMYDGNMDQNENGIPWFSQDAMGLLDVQKALASEEALIHYFCGQDKVYMLGVLKDTAFIHIETIPGLNDLVLTYNSYLTNPECDIDSFISLSKYLYKKLLRPLQPLPRKLIICPHGLLQKVSFETLLFPGKDSNFKDWRQLPYSIQKHQFQYILSGALWKYSHDIKPQKGDFSIVYPTYKSKHSDKANKDFIQPLLFGDAEATSIQDAVPIDVNLITATSIDKKLALNIFKKSSVTHFIGHAQAEDHKLRDSKLNLSVEGGSGDLYMHQIAVEHLPAQLITLSACETSAGVFEEGEGMASLTRAFTLSGSKSIISTLWPVNDWSTVPIMTSFYDCWTKGKEKSHALQSSKINYINNCRDVALAHPFYWSAFVVYGSDDTWEGQPSKNLFLGLAFLSIIFISGFVWYFFSTRRKSNPKTIIN